MSDTLERLTLEKLECPRVARWYPGWVVDDEMADGHAVTTLDLGAVCFQSFTRAGEYNVTGEGVIARLDRSCKMNLNAAALEEALLLGDQLPQNWPRDRCIYFTGTIVVSPEGDRSALGLTRRSGRWQLVDTPLKYNWDPEDVVACLERG